MVFAWFVVVKVDGERERYASGAVQSLTRLATKSGSISGEIGDERLSRKWGKTRSLGHYYSGSYYLVHYNVGLVVVVTKNKIKLGRRA